LARLLHPYRRDGVDLLMRNHVARRHERLRVEVVGHRERDVFPIGHYASQVVPNQLIVRTVLVLQRLDMVKDGLYLHHVFRRNPQLFPRLVKTGLLDVFDLVHSVVLLLSPFQLLIQEVKNHEIQRP
jgi:hypothetical protein